jgi:drug/metabolite transporter (DMT)-like permease
LCGLVLVVYQSFALARFSIVGMLFALAALASVTAGAILQKRITQAPVEVLPLQYAVSLLLCLFFVPSQRFEFEPSVRFLIPLLWLGLVISVIAQLLLYRLIRSGNLVNVTSLFYLVPVVTAAMDYVFLGNRLSSLSLVGMAAILSGLALASELREGP